MESANKNKSSVDVPSKLPALAELIDESILDDLLPKHKIAKDEYGILREVIGRAPTISELGVFSAMWSEHCSYKSSRVHLGRLPTKADQVVVGPGENAGVVHIDGDYCVAFKMESHNHPSYIEPYHGAATGVGGIMRDVFCMGARPIANFNCLRFGEKTHRKTKNLLHKTVEGIGDYGNCVGVPTVGGNLSFHKSYNGNCLVNAMTVGSIHKDRIFKGFASGVGNYVIYVGSATGRDGIHGATMASESFVESSATKKTESKTTIQVGDPFMENILLEATLEILDEKLVIGLQDMGAAGLTSSAVEMAGRAGNGLYLDFSRVPIRTKTPLTAYELLLSESQERMLMVCTPEKWPELEKLIQKWELAYDIIGSVTDTGKMQVVFDGELEVDIPVGPLTDAAPKYERPMVEASSYTPRTLSSVVEIDDWQNALETLLQAKPCHSKVYERYDQHIGLRTILGPEQQGAAVVWPQSDWMTNKDVGVAISAACEEDLTAEDSGLGTQYAVLKAARMIFASGGKPLAITDCMNFGNPEDPVIMRQFSDSVDGMTIACNELDAPVIGGNVSLYNQTGTTSIHPTPMIGMVGKIADVHAAVPASLIERSPKLKPMKHLNIYWLGPKQSNHSWVGSVFAREHEIAANDLASIDYAYEKKAAATLQQWNKQNNSMIACRDIASSGTLATILKMTRCSSQTKIDLKSPESSKDLGDKSAFWFARNQGYIVFASEMPTAPEEEKVQVLSLGSLELAGSGGLSIDGQELNMVGISQAWKGGLHEI